MNTIIFSIIIPLYNKAPYICKALEGVLAQTYPDYECIVMDDGSTDNSQIIVSNWLSKYRTDCSGRFHLLSQPNQGVAMARNNAAKAAKGGYLCFLDADDWWEPTFLQEMAQLIHDYPDAGLYFTNYIYYKPGKTRIALHLPSGYINYPRAYYESKIMLATSSSSSMPKRIFEEMGGFPIGVKLGEDFLLWAQTAIHYPVAYSDKPVAFFNNDVPPSMRATRRMYPPQCHMLWHLDSIKTPLRNGINSHNSQIFLSDWECLFDMLRVNGLLDYWLSPQYHDMAKAELSKVDWSRQPRSVIRTYRTPLCLLRAKRKIMQMGSFFKQKLVKLAEK